MITFRLMKQQTWTALWLCFTRKAGIRWQLILIVLISSWSPSMTGAFAAIFVVNKRIHYTVCG
ncbi:hypothetical protein SAMN05421503_2912 [Terribacillus aidingensis]|uniref:Uncharacterized protein n=1 Tax=Terribacillus aidingensis TaxID=586416 RepID=A0A285P3H2_9BACI|nr:hypothetical protein [Terribacillus aidingensis]SNZ16280.1 hypothetical protein SAMN05421503_2912 [Terribacillus aidingensis]